MTLRGAKLALRAEAAAHRSGQSTESAAEGNATAADQAKSRNMKLYERLQMLRTMLCEMRESLGEDGTTLDEMADVADIDAVTQEVAAAVEAVAQETVAQETVANAATVAEPKVPKPKSAPKGEKESARPLFVEQSLFG